MSFIELKFTLKPYYPFNEILIAQLSELGFDAFTEEEPSVCAYIEKKDYASVTIEQMDFLNMDGLELSYEVSEIAKENWNKKWEASFDPVTIDSFCVVRAPFHHVDQDFEHEIIIEPKMSFGTGHHETTQSMVRQMKDLPIKGAAVLDMGSGTGILAILASKMQAKAIVAIDIEEWAYENIAENIERNLAQHITYKLGDASTLKKVNQTYDIVLANINKNILLKDIKTYTQYLKLGGSLVLSGFFVYDNDELIEHCNNLGYELVNKLSQKDWSSLCFRWLGK